MDSQEGLQEFNETPSQSFTMLLQEGRQYNNENPPQPKKKSTTKKTNFSIEEDVLLVKAWLNTGLDPIQGNSQKSTKFWDRILENYNENKKETTVERTAHSLSNRWSFIQKVINKFCGYLEQVEHRNQSGIGEQDKINMAKAMYQELNNNAIFQFEHLWNMLKTVPKWKKYMLTQSDLKRKCLDTSTSYPLDVIHLGEDNNDQDVHVALERPIGKKAAKERERKRKSNNCGEKEIVMEVLSGLAEAKKRLHEERKKEIDTTKEEIIRIEKQKLEHLEVQVKDGSIYSGIFHATNTTEKDFGIILKMARLTKDGSVRGQKATAESVSKAPSKTFIIPGKELVQVVAKGVSVTRDELSHEVQHEKQQELMLDSSISQSRYVEMERELEPWVPGEDDPQFPELDNIFDDPWHRLL
ncbi:uncharacterized protein LOC132174498 [Corylus avellana]|uniref:uncharacterized protein LOC132174498 n=1 Tax=Corylus avellana TaxID=13451 RepID=UPI00286C5DDC|nr:uncharacterized protein LOC132174498 [Corylus avellana]